MLYRKREISAISIQLHLKELYGECYPHSLAPSEFLGALISVIVSGPVHTNPFSNENGAVLLRFQKDLHPHIVFVSFSPVHTTTSCLFQNAVVPSVRMVKWTRRVRILIYWPAKLARNWSHIVASVCHFGYSRSSGLAPGRVYFDDVKPPPPPPQIPSFSPSTLQNSVFKKHRFQIAPLWRAFSNGSVFGDRFRRCRVDDSRIRSKTTQFSFENGLVWTGPQSVSVWNDLIWFRV